jgi:hypothetical protein
MSEGKLSLIVGLVDRGGVVTAQGTIIAELHPAAPDRPCPGARTAPVSGGDIASVGFATCTGCTLFTCCEASTTVPRSAERTAPRRRLVANGRRKKTGAARIDVAIVGAGPVGLTLANTLGALGLRMLLVERLDAIIDYPRAIGIDDESLRTIQATGLADRVRTHMTPDHWMRYVTAGGRCFASIEPRTDGFGWSRRNAFIQPEIDRILSDGIARHPAVRVLLGHALDGFAQDADGVTLELLGPEGARVAARAAWMVASDGGNSFVRRTLGIPFEGRTKPNQWIVVDVRNDPIGTPHIHLHCDPQRPYVSAALPHAQRPDGRALPGGPRAVRRRRRARDAGLAGPGLRQRPARREQPGLEARDGGAGAGRRCGGSCRPPCGAAGP